MKKLLLSLLMTVMCITSAWAHDFESGGIYYNITDETNKTVAVTFQGSSYNEFKEYTGSVTIPAKVTHNSVEYSVASISNGAFRSCDGLTSVTIPNSVTAIGERAFYDCTGLTSVTLSENLTVISYMAFVNCIGLTKITIPADVTKIGKYALYCEGLTEITSLATTPPTIESTTFYLVSKTIPLYVPVGCVEAYKAADYWKVFTNIQVVDEIPVGAVIVVDGISYKTTGTETVEVTSGTEKYSGAVVIPEKVTYDGVEYSVTSIGERAFYDCTGLTSVTIPNSVTVIGERAFYDCTGLTSVTIPNSVTVIGERAFYDCTGLTSVTIPNSVTVIGERAFCYCTGLTSLTIPASVTAIGNNAFNDCSGLASIVVAEGNTKYDSRDNCNALIETATHTLLTGCKNTTIPNSVTAIGNRAFELCRGLVSITIPGSITSIGVSVFNGCSGLTQITCLVATPPAIESTTFSGVSKTISLFVMPGCVEAYQAADYWKEFTNIQVVGEIPVGAVIVVDGISYKTTGTETVEVTSGTEKYSGAVVIPEKVTYDGVEYSVTAIGNSAFNECDSMTSVTLPNSITTIGDDAFYNCTGLTEITIPNSVTSIGYMGFSGCKSLTSITIPENVTSIGVYAFHVCEGLTEITSLATTPPAIDSSTFSYVSKTIPLYVPEGCVEAYKAAEHWKEFTFVVDVATVLADSIALDKDSAAMIVGDNLTLVATVLPDSVTNGKVVWSSNNEAVATVDSLGNVVAVAEGVAIITATTTDGTNLTAQCVVEVKQPSGIVSTDADGVAIVTESGAIVVKNAPMGSVVNIYTITGTVAATTQVTAPVTRIAVDTRGIYIVQVGNTAKKVVM